MTRTPPRSLLIIKPGSMGDVIHGLPVASAIHNFWPQTKITWIVDPRWKALLENNPAIARIHTFPRQEFRGPIGWCKAIRWFCELRHFRSDIVLDLQGLLRSALMARLSGSKCIHGLRDAREGALFFYTVTNYVGINQHAVNRYLNSLAGLGVPVPKKVEFTINNKKTNINIFKQDNYIVLHPFSRGLDKSLTSESILSLASTISKYANIKIILVGMGKTPLGIEQYVTDLIGKTSLEELSAIIEGARFVISVDSGPMHLASALGVPLLGIHTWSDPRLVGPYDESAWIWQGGEIRRQDLQHPPLPEKHFSVKDAENVANFVVKRISTT